MNNNPEIGIIVGSKSDLPIISQAEELLKKCNIPYLLNIVSAHRTPDKMYEYAKDAHKKGVKVIIAGAGGAAHLPGMVASITPLPVIGVPILSGNSLIGLDSILSILQMPKGVPVATVALNNAYNAALLAIKILATYNYAYRAVNLL
ncbi:MAG: 5-(carboxyamino)imidazole ribonucleotide mutase [Solitalea-like symbiont of Acarus siro]